MHPALNKTRRWLVAGALTLGAQMSGALEPENVALVVNAQSWASVTLAEAYARLRGIPATNVISLTGLPSFETVTVDVFRDQILKPVFGAIESRGLANRIDCIAYSADIPYSIQIGSDFGANKVNPHVGGLASLTGLTFLHQPVLARAPQAYTALEINRYARRAVIGPRAQPPSEEEGLVVRESMRLMHEKRNREAVRLLSDFCAKRPSRPFALYNLACALGTTGRPEEALNTLRQAAEAGWWNSAHTDRDPDLSTVRTLPGYKEVLARMEESRANLSTQEPVPFSARTAWGEDGRPVFGSSGIRYMLSVMLGVTSGRGASVREAVAGLERAAAADGARPAGTVYYMRNPDIRSQTRSWGFEAAVRLLKEAGVRAVIEDGNLPKEKADIAGLMAGVADFDFPASGSRLLPGAIAEHLTSCGGIMTWGGGQTELTQFLRHGAAGASGTVTEPYAIQAKFPDPFIHVHYVRGATLAEAFYQSVTGPYQLLIVGDPLCRPWGRKRNSKKGTDPFPVPAPDLGAALKPEAGLTPDALRKGLRLAGANETRALAGTVGNQPWRNGAVAPTGGVAAIEGYVEARTNDLYQFQVLGDVPVRIQAGGRELTVTGAGGWRMAPVHLEAGWHAVSIRLAETGAAARAASLPGDIRFGAAGVGPLGPQLRFKPRADEAIHHLGLGMKAAVEALEENPFAVRAALAVEGFDPGVEGSLALAWEAEAGWSVEPAGAETRVAKGVCEPMVFQFRYTGEAYGTNAFFRMPRCRLDLRGGTGRETADPVALALELLLKGKVRPTLRIPRLAYAPVIDGRLDEKAWAGAPQVTRLVRPQLDKPAGQATTAWMGWDARGLSVAVRCREPRLKDLRLAARSRDDSAYMDDSVELFIDPAGDGKAYYQVVVNAGGVIYDGKGQDRAWNGEFQFATGREAEAWTLELAIPWSTLGAEPKGGGKIKFLLARNRKAGDDEPTLWPCVPGGNHQPQYFAEGILEP